MYMTWDGLLAAFGGIFGLCLGGSVISLVEMIYYFTLRLYNRMHSLWRQPNERSNSIPSIIGTSLPMVGKQQHQRPSKLQTFDVDRNENAMANNRNIGGGGGLKSIFSMVNEQRPAVRPYLR